MLGIDNAGVSLAYLLCVLSALLCVVYGLITWNRGAETVEEADKQWVEEEKKVEEEL